MLPGLKTYATCVKFNPYLYVKQPPKLDKNGEEIPALIDLPYRMVFAVATTDQILLYTTDCIQPIAIIGNIHYATINDMCWHGRTKLIACSSDGYCSVITFATEDQFNAVGVRLPNDQIPNEQLRAHYDAIDLVNLKLLESEVQKTKTDQFVTI
jgi:chromatin assembly factor 1 subunit B